MKQKILVIGEDDKEIYVDMWFDESLIKGFYMTDENYVDDSVNIITGDNSITLKQTPELKEYLLSKNW